jgi:hypothetical protein
VARRTGNSEYRPRMILNADGTVSVNASQFVNGSESALGKPVVVNGLSVTPGSFIWFRAQVTGANPTTIRVKVWADGQQEPSSWHFTTTSSQTALQGVGGAGLRTYLESSVSNAPVTITFDDYSVTSTASSTSVATDAFARTRSSSWGGADMGGLWRLIGSASSFNVANGVGTIDLPAPGASRGAMLDEVNQMSVDIRFRVAVSKVPAGNNLIVYAVARRNTNNEYRPRIMFQPDGSIRVGSSVLVGGSETMLGTPVILSGFKPAAGSFVWVHAQVTGASPTTIRVKAWADGQSEPAAWQYSATSSHAAVQVAGNVGLRAYLSAKVGNAPIRVTFDDYSVSTAQ